VEGILWISVVLLSLAEGYVLVRVIQRLGGISNVLLMPRRPDIGYGTAVVGRRIRRIRCFSVDAHDATAAGRLPYVQEGVVILIDTRSVAGRRAVSLTRSLSALGDGPISWTWCVGGGSVDVSRFAREANPIGTVIRVRRRIVTRALASGVPVAVYVGPEGVVRHVGLLSDWKSLVSFVGACPNTAFRLWLRRANSEPRIPVATARAS
jgi:hypothetical protein